METSPLRLDLKIIDFHSGTLNEAQKDELIKDLIEFGEEAENTSLKDEVDGLSCDVDEMRSTLSDYEREIIELESEVDKLKGEKAKKLKAKAKEMLDSVKCCDLEIMNLDSKSYKLKERVQS